jgi:signal peptidase I
MTNDDQDPLGDTRADAEGAAATRRLRVPQAADPETAQLRAPQPAMDGQPARDSRAAADGQAVTDGQAAMDGEAAAGGGPVVEDQTAAGDESGPEEEEDESELDKNRAAAKKGSFWRELPILMVIALAIALVIKTFVVQMFFIPSGSMQNTLEINDRVMVNKLVYHFRSVQPGDIVVFDGDGSWDPEPPSPKPSSDPVVRLWDDSVDRLFHSFVGMFNGAAQDNIYIKRVIGVPGDHVACCNASGDVTINGVALNEQSYLYPGNSPGSAPSPTAGHFNLTVPPGRLWVLGDHRQISDDSRLHSQDPDDGTIPESAVIGRAFVIVWPPSRWRFLPIPSTFNQAGINGAKSPSALAEPAALAVSAAPFLPLAGGFGAALPLTLVQRRLRRRGLRWLRGRGLRRASPG